MNLYVVRNQSGQFFRAKGYGGHGDTWIDSLDKAKFYAKIGQAKSRVTYFAREYPQFGTPSILQFTLDVNQAVVMDMTETTKKATARIERNKVQREQRSRQWEIDRLETQQRESAARLKELKK